MSVQKLTTRKILERNLSRTPPSLLQDVKVWIHNIRSLHNVGAVFRSADAFGISEILLSGFTPSPPRPEISKTAIGAEKFVEWRHQEEAESIVEYLQTHNYYIASLEQTTNSTPLPEFTPPSSKPLCLLFGNEVTGIENRLLEMADECIEVPQYGHKHSLNISVTVGAVLYGILQKEWQGSESG